MEDLFKKKPLNKVLNASLKVNKYFLREINRMRYQKQVLELVKYLPKNSRVLDLGCGEGHISALLKYLRPDLRVDALDMPSKKENYLKIVTDNFDVEFREGSALETPYKKNSFDAVLSFGVMEHIVDFNAEKMRDKSKRNPEEEARLEKKYLSEVRRILKPKGIFFICNLPSKLAVNEKYAELAWGGGHYRRYWKKEVIGLLSDNKLNVEKIKREYFIPAQFYLVSKTIDNYANRHYKLVFFLDNILMLTPLRFFC